MGGNRVCSPCDTRNSISASPMVRVALIVPAFDIENREFTNKIQSKMMISQQSHNAKHTHNLFIQTESNTVHGIFCFHCATVSVDEIFCFVANGLRNNGLRALLWYIFHPSPAPPEWPFLALESKMRATHKQRWKICHIRVLTDCRQPIWIVFSVSFTDGAHAALVLFGVYSTQRLSTDDAVRAQAPVREL